MVWFMCCGFLTAGGEALQDSEARFGGSRVWVGLGLQGLWFVGFRVYI